jgi:hypothetical protein
VIAVIARDRKKQKPKRGFSRMNADQNLQSSILAIPAILAIE